MVVNCEKPQLEEEKQARGPGGHGAQMRSPAPRGNADAGSTAERVQGVAVPPRAAAHKWPNSLS